MWDTSSSQGRLLSTLLAAIAEFERRGVTWAAEVVESSWYRYRSFYDPEGNILHLTMPDRAALGLNPA